MESPKPDMPIKMGGKSIIVWSPITTCFNLLLLRKIFIQDYRIDRIVFALGIDSRWCGRLNGLDCEEEAPASDQNEQFYKSPGQQNTTGLVGDRLSLI